MHGPLASAFRVEWHSLAEPSEFVAQWGDLAKRAVTANVFYDPAFALAAMPVFGADVGAGFVWSKTAPAKLLGFFPARIERRRYGVSLPVLVGWTHPYAPLGSPLVDRTACEDVIAAWLAYAANSDELPKLMLLPYLPAEGSLGSAFDRVIADRDLASACFGRHARALLAPASSLLSTHGAGANREHYLQNAIEKKKRKELRRQRSRLADNGLVTTLIAEDPGHVACAIEEFLTLEASGWKGRARTAAHFKPAIVKFMSSALTALAAQGRAQIIRLCLNDRATAAVMILRGGSSAWCWKIAYDETYARFSPGVQVVLDATAMLLRDPEIGEVDSCATPDHPMIDHLWRERLVLWDRLIAVLPGETFNFRLACALEGLRRGAIRLAKAARNRALRT